MPSDPPPPQATRPGDDAARAATITERTAHDKAALIDQLRKTPVIQIACEKMGISRMTYYRWRNDDPDFMKATDEALLDGKTLVNDLAESQLLSALKDGEPWSIQYWLRHHHSEYSNKLEITAKAASDALTPEQQEQLNHALELAGVLPPIAEPDAPLVSPPPSANGNHQ